MSVALFIVEIAVVFVATLAALHYYGNLKRTHILVTLAVFISWFFSFLIVFILPMDVTNTCYENCLRRSASNHSYWSLNNNGSGPSNGTTTPQPHTTSPPGRGCVKPWSHMPLVVLPYVWRVIYWSSMLLSWILMPIMQSYVYAGDFTVWGKLKTALYENSMWYVSYLAIFIGLLIYVGVDPELSVNIGTLKLICITASNTWGLILLVLLMGYGLTELPRHIWNMSLPNLRLEKTFFKVAKLNTEREDADDELSRLLSEVKRASEEIKYNNSLRKYLDIIIGKCPIGSETLFNKGTEDYVDYVNAEGRSQFTIKELIKLHKNIIVMSHRAVRTQFQWNAALKLTFYLEDVIKAESNTEKLFTPSFTEYNPSSKLSSTLQWYWHIILRPWILKLVGVLLLILSISLVWSEVSFFSSNPTLSIFALLTEVTNKNNFFLSMEVISCFVIAYMCVCTYYTVFKMKFFNYYYFASNHQTDSNSLLFSGYLFCRLTYALCLNFLAMIHMDGHITGQTDRYRLSETNFTRFMGHLDLLAFISKGFNIYYPMIVLLVCLCTYFRLGKRCLHCFGVDQFIIDDDFSADLVREGKDIAKREKRKLERQINGTDWIERSKDIRSKYARFGRSGSGSPRGVETSQRVDDSDDKEIVPTDGDGPKVSIKTRLGTGGVKKKYTTEANDKLDLLSNIEYTPPEPSETIVTSRGYDHIGGMSRTSVPRNIFDDA